jgi:putative ABC transport system permease protein
MFHDLGRDLRFARRTLFRAPVLTAAAIGSIGLGVAATTAVFSVVDAALFRPPPLDHPEQLAILYGTSQPVNGGVERARWSWPRFRLLQQSLDSLAEVGSFSQSVLAITSDEPEPVNAEIVSSSYFETLRVQPVAGRAFARSDDNGEGTHDVALIGYDLWQRRFAGERSAIGRSISVNSVPLTVIGILPAGFAGLTGRAQLWVSPSIAPRVSYPGYLTTNQNFISVVARLRPGVAIARLRAELAILGEAIHQRGATSVNQSVRHSAIALSLNEARVDPTTRLPMWILLGASACLLLLACANVAGLLLGRAISRRREIAIRVATGATRARVVRQLLVESALLAVTGGVVGVLVAIPLTLRLGLPAAAWRGRNQYGSLGEFATPRVDLRVVLFSIALCALTTILFGLAPALRAARVDLTSALKDGSGRGRARGESRVELRQLIVAAETALAVVLLVAGALLAASWRRIETTDAGFDRTHLLSFLIRPSEVTYPPAKAPVLIARVLSEIERLPSVEAATVDGCFPASTGCANSTLYIVGRPQPSAAEAPGVLRHYVGPDHFRTLRVPILRGRAFNDGDRAGRNRVAIINQEAARRFWPNEDPIGRRVWFGGGSSFDRSDSSAEIVGIAADVAYQTYDDHPLQPDFFTPYAQFTYATRMVLVRTRGDPLLAVPDIRRAVRAADPDLALFDVRDMRDRAGDSWARLSYQTRILSAFATIALLLAGMGIFAIIAHVISDRRREIGIRIALGASTAGVLSAVGVRGARPAAFGILIGGVTAVAVGRLLSSLVFGVPAFDLLPFAAVLLTVIVVSLLATYLAARRALVIEPVEAMRV